MKSKKKIQKVSKDKSVTLPVQGMTCSSCRHKIESNLENIEGVKKVEADVKRGRVKISYNETDQTDQTDQMDAKHEKVFLNKIKSEIHSLGYATETTNSAKNVKNNNAARKGILYGLIPHAGCIAFIIASILGATLFMNLLRPLMMNAYFFYALIVISLIFATISAAVYLKKNRLLSFDGVVRQKKYLMTLYSTTIIINLVLFLIIFPLSANLGSASSSTSNEYSKTLNLDVVIPCSGHAPLIINDLNQMQGVQEVKYTFPYKFVVKYDENVTNSTNILSAEIFEEFPGTIMT